MNQNAEYSAVNDAVRGQFLRRTWAMITPYWRSEEKGKAWLLLAHSDTHMHMHAKALHCSHADETRWMNIVHVRYP